MVVDITLYKDGVHILCAYNNVDASQWIAYSDDTKDKSIDLINKWYSMHKNSLLANNICISIHDHDYFSAQDGK